MSVPKTLPLWADFSFLMFDPFSTYFCMNPAGHPEKIVYFPRVLNTAHNHLTTGHPVGRLHTHLKITEQNYSCLCAFSFPDMRPASISLPISLDVGQRPEINVLVGAQSRCSAAAINVLLAFRLEISKTPSQPWLRHWPSGLVVPLAFNSGLWETDFLPLLSRLSGGATEPSQPDLPLWT